MSGIIVPVVIHFCIMNMVYMMRLHVDAASLTTLASLITLPVFFHMMKEDRKRKKRMPVINGAFQLRDAVVIIVLALAANGGMTVFVSALSDIFSFSAKTQDALFESNFFVQLLGVGIIVPIQEEVLFRGLVYQRLKDYNKSWLSIILAAAFFAIYHGNVVQMLFAFPMAILMIAIYEKWGMLLAPVLFHITVNLSSVLLAARG